MGSGLRNRFRPPMLTTAGSITANHRLVLRGLRALEQLACRIGSDGEDPAGDAARLLTFFRDFYLHTHQHVVTESLLPAVLADGDPESLATAGALTADQHEAEELLHALTLLWEPEWMSEEERQHFGSLAHLFVRRVRRTLRAEQELLSRTPDSLHPPSSTSLGELEALRRHWQQL
jgi:hypothetical protein